MANLAAGPDPTSEGSGLAEALASTRQAPCDAALRLVACALLGIPTGLADVDSAYLDDPANPGGPTLETQHGRRMQLVVREVFSDAEVAELFAVTAVRIPRTARQTTRVVEQAIDVLRESRLAGAASIPLVHDWRLQAACGHLGRLAAVAAALYCARPTVCEQLHGDLASSAAEACALAAAACVSAGLVAEEQEGSNASSGFGNARDNSIGGSGVRRRVVPGAGAESTPHPSPPGSEAPAPPTEVQDLAAGLLRASAALCFASLEEPAAQAALAAAAGNGPSPPSRPLAARPAGGTRIGGGSSGRGGLEPDAADDLLASPAGRTALRGLSAALPRAYTRFVPARRALLYPLAMGLCALGLAVLWGPVALAGEGGRGGGSAKVQAALQALADVVAALIPDSDLLTIPATAAAARSGVTAVILLAVVIPLTLWRFNTAGWCLGTEISAARGDQVGAAHAYLCEDPLVRGLFDASSTTGALADGAPTVAMTAPAAVSETESDLLAAGATIPQPETEVAALVEHNLADLLFSNEASLAGVADTGEAPLQPADLIAALGISAVEAEAALRGLQSGGGAESASSALPVRVPATLVTSLQGLLPALRAAGEDVAADAIERRLADTLALARTESASESALATAGISAAPPGPCE